MNLKPAALLLLVIASLLLAGCRKDAEINTALSEVDSFTDELIKRARATPDSTDGIDTAQQYLDSRKREIKAKASFLARVRGIQASDETERRLIETIKRDQLNVMSLQSDPSLRTLSMSNATVKPKLDKLINDYLELFQS